MNTVVRVSVLICVLCASVIGAADAGAAAKGRVGGEGAAVCGLDDASSGALSCQLEDDCTVCTPLCHCSLHGGSAVVAGAVTKPPPGASSIGTHEAGYRKLPSDPPALPPPIL